MSIYQKIKTFILVLSVSLLGCGPISKTPQPPFKLTYFNDTQSQIQVGIAGLGDPNWPNTSFSQPSPPSIPVQISPNSWAVFYWKVPPQQPYIETFQSANVLAFGRDYGPNGLDINVR